MSLDSFNNVLSDDNRLYLYLTDWYVIRYMEAYIVSVETGTPVPEDKKIPQAIIEAREAARQALNNG